MKIVEPSYLIEDELNGSEILRKIERAGRTCYKSEIKISDESAEAFIKSILKRGHESVIEHEKITVRLICDRGVSHEIVRHRLASYSQESTRYCNYSDDKFGSEITVIKPFYFLPGTKEWNIWYEAMLAAERAYFDLLNNGTRPQEARSVLPNSLKTEIVITCNLREWRHLLHVRTAKNAHPQMRQILTPLLHEFKEKIPIIFDDINPI
jgi:thymidylate synthase (FAD)